MLTDAEDPNAEPIIFPELRICDSHHHLWHRPQYDYLTADYLRDIGGGHRIVSSVFVECGTDYRDEPGHREVGEVEFADAAATDPTAALNGLDLCAAIVGFTDLSAGAAAGDALDAHMAASRRFRGIRHCAAIDPNPSILSAAHSIVFEGMLGDARFREGFAELGKRGLTFDAWVYHPQLPELVSLARAFPDITIILDHLGGPLGIGPYKDRRSDIFRDWRHDMAMLARCDNVVVKLGGICMPLNGWGLHKRAAPIGSEELAGLVGDFFRSAIDLFGATRCLFESNYPADRPSVPYRTLWNMFKRLTRDFSEGERQLMFHDNAARIYRIADQ